MADDGRLMPQAGITDIGAALDIATVPQPLPLSAIHEGTGVGAP